jgi:N-methylhydantoinase A
MKQPEISRLARTNGASKIDELATRPVYFLEEDRFVPTKIYDRYALNPGFSGEGPAVIVEYGSSTLIGPGDTFQVGKLGEIDIVCHH